MEDLPSGLLPLSSGSFLYVSPSPSALLDLHRACRFKQGKRRAEQPSDRRLDAGFGDLVVVYLH